MTNSEISDVFSLYSKLLDIHRDNEFKVKSYANAAFQIDKLITPLEEMPQEKIAMQRGIGEKLAQQVKELLETGQLKELEAVINNTPPGVLELIRIKGIGPKKIATIWHDLQIESPGELLYACNENRLSGYKGFGIKSQQTIQEALEFYFNNQSKFLYAAIEPLAHELTRFLKKIFSGVEVIPTGAFVRQCDIIESLDYIIVGEIEEIIELLDQQDSFEFVEEEGGTLYFKYLQNISLEIICIDSNQLTEMNFFAGNSISFNDTFQEKYPEVSFEGDIASDKEIFDQAQISYLPSYLRDHPDALIWAEQHQIPQVISHSDIKGVIHNHSTWSDGKASILEMAQTCIQLGYEYLVMSDHSVSSFYANGLSIDRIYEQQEEIDRLNEQLFPFHIFKSIECDILGDGQLDYPEAVLKTFDLVIASIHQNLNMSQEKAMSRVLTAIANPYTTILGHPSGRLLLSRKSYPLNYEAVIETCKKENVAIEINANPRRLDLDWQYISKAMDASVMLSINPDAHSTKGIEDIRYGVLSAQKGGMTKTSNLSSMDLTTFKQFLHNRKIAKGL